MVNVLIPTKPDDAHSIFVKLALKNKGHDASLWYTSDFPQQQKHSFKLHSNNLTWQSVGNNHSVSHLDEFEVVWLRRPRYPIISDQICAEDRKNATHENRAFFKMLWQVIAPNAFWINPPHSLNKVNCKLEQLIMASSLGLKIPESLISNDPNEIKAFMQHNIGLGTIYKTFLPSCWIEGSFFRLAYTSEINFSDLPSDLLLQNMPGIFQTKLQKAYELRVTFFGNHVSCVKLHSQQHPKGTIDWRYIPTHELIIEEYDLPFAIIEKCKKLMEAMGIVFGCFDFIVTPDNEYYFLEVNEQGQFLWIEEVNPSIKMLDMFTEFLISSSKNFSWQPSTSSLSLADFRVSMEVLKKNAIASHINPGIF